MVNWTRDQDCPCGFRGSPVWVWLSRERVGGILAPLTVTFTPPGPKPLAPKGLQYLVLLSHAHSRECSLVPGLRGPGGRDGGLVWECSAGHTFSWGPSSGPTPPEEAKAAPIPSTAGTNWCLQARGRQEPAGRPGERGVVEKGREKGPSSGAQSLFSKNVPFSMEKLCWHGSISSNMFLDIKSKIQNRIMVY